MSPTQKYLLVGGIGGVAVYLLWRMWPKEPTVPVVEEEQTYMTSGFVAQHAGFSPSGPMATMPGDTDIVETPVSANYVAENLVSETPVYRTSGF